MEKENELIKTLYAVIAVTVDEKDAKNLAELFLSGFEPVKRLEILKGLENIDSRFLGWDSKLTFHYETKNVCSNSLYLSSAVAELILTDMYDIKLTLTERL